MLLEAGAGGCFFSFCPMSRWMLGRLFREVCLWCHRLPMWLPAHTFTHGTSSLCRLTFQTCFTAPATARGAPWAKWVVALHWADPNEVNKRDGETALHKAVRGANPYCITSLLGTPLPHGRSVDLWIRNHKVRSSSISSTRRLLVNLAKLAAEWDLCPQPQGPSKNSFKFHSS